MSDRPMLTVHDCALRLNCADQLVRRLIAAGKLPGSKIGRDWRIDPDHLEQFLAGVRPVQPEPVIPDSERLPDVEHPRFS